MKLSDAMDLVVCIRDISNKKLTHTARLKMLYEKLSKASIKHIEYLQANANEFYIHPSLKKEIIQNLDYNVNLYDQMQETLNLLTQDIIEEQRALVPFLETFRSELENMSDETQ